MIVSSMTAEGIWKSESNLDEDVWRPCWGWVYGRESPLPQRGFAWVSPLEKFGNFMWKWSVWGQNCYFVSISNKVQFCPKLLVTNGSLMLRNGNLVEGFQWNLPQIFTVCVGFAVNVFQGQRSKVKVTARPSALLPRRHTFRQCSVEAYLFCFTCVSLSVCGWRKVMTAYRQGCYLPEKGGRE